MLHWFKIVPNHIKNSLRALQYTCSIVKHNIFKVIPFFNTINSTLSTLFQHNCSVLTFVITVRRVNSATDLTNHQSESDFGYNAGGQSYQKYEEVREQLH